MKRTRHAFLFLIILLTGTFCYVDPDPGDGTTQVQVVPYEVTYPSEVAEWTVLFYIAGDNNLEYDAVRHLDWLEGYPGVSNTNVHIIALIDRIPGYSTGDSNWTGTRMYWIRPDGTDNQILSPRLSVPELGLNHYGDDDEINMADPDTLNHFGGFCVSNFPANHYALMIWNHGGGWRETDSKGEAFYPQNIAVDDTSDGDVLLNYEVRAALASYRFDVIYLHACLMGMLETAYEFQDVADYLVASPEIMYGWPLEWMDAFLQSPLTVSDFYTELFNAFTLRFANVEGSTFAVYDLSKADPAVRAFDRYAESWCETTNHWWDDWGVSYTNHAGADFDAIMAVTEQYYEPAHNIDPYHLAEMFPLDGAEELKSAIDDMVVLEWNHPSGDLEYGNVFSSGTAVHFWIYDGYVGEYTNLARFNRDVPHWMDYIRAYESFPPFPLITDGEVREIGLNNNEAYRTQFYVNSPGKVTVTLQSPTNCNDDLFLFDKGNLLSSSQSSYYGGTDEITVDLISTGWHTVKVVRTGGLNYASTFRIRLSNHNADIY